MRWAQTSQETRQGLKVKNAATASKRSRSRINRKPRLSSRRLLPRPRAALRSGRRERRNEPAPAPPEGMIGFQPQSPPRVDPIALDGLWPALQTEAPHPKGADMCGL